MSVFLVDKNVSMLVFGLSFLFVLNPCLSLHSLLTQLCDPKT